MERGNEFSRALQACVLNKVPPGDSHVIRKAFEHHVWPGQAAASP